MLTVDGKTVDWVNIPLPTCLEGNAMDTHFTLKLYEFLRKELEKEDSLKVNDLLISPSLGMFSDMEFNGMNVSIDELDDVGVNLLIHKNNIENDLLETCPTGTNINPASTRSLREVLFTDESGFMFEPPQITIKGSPSTDKDSLEYLLDFIESELTSREE